jgi:hypothetical protein
MSVSKLEQEQFTQNMAIQHGNMTVGNNESPVKPGQTVQVNCRATVREVGPEITVVELSELREQGKVGNPIYIYVPNHLVHPTSAPPQPRPA